MSGAQGCRSSAGLSPRLRGSHQRDGLARLNERPIPAPAGEPWAGSAGRWGQRAYPRACGGAEDHLVAGARFSGLSPRLRGSHPCGPGCRHRRRPIPAPAGEPCSGLPRTATSGAYPRACGGARAAPPAGSERSGLSPRLRGSLLFAVLPMTMLGPIPAPAGEPRSIAGTRCRSRAYPRACGGASRNASPGDRIWGLSPRLRGSRRPAGASTWARRPIPAPAGEPASRWPIRRTCRAYPRACGGAALVMGAS